MKPLSASGSLVPPPTLQNASIDTILDEDFIRDKQIYDIFSEDRYRGLRIKNWQLKNTYKI